MMMRVVLGAEEVVYPTTPTSWVSIGGAVITDSGENYGTVDVAKIATGGLNYGRARATGLMTRQIGDIDRFECVVKMGDSPSIAIRFDATGSVRTLAGVLGSLIQTNPLSPSEVLWYAQTELNDGYWRVRGDFRWGVDATDAHFGVGPNSSIAGEYCLAATGSFRELISG
jgi:hypothetical protein